MDHRSSLSIPCIEEGSTGAAAGGLAVAGRSRLLTSTGWQPIESLRAGDVLITAAGQQRRLSRTTSWEAGGEEAAQPIRVCAGAFGPDLPRCDVVLSPDQTVFIENVLIPVRLLANGATVRRETANGLRYFRLGLAAADVVLADGLPVGCDADAAGTQDDEDTLARGVPVCSGSILQRSRAHLLARADALDYRMTQDADLHLSADGVRVWGRLAKGTWSGWVRAGVQELRILSRASAPADCLAESNDHRRLGVALRGAAVRTACQDRLLDAAAPGWGAGVYPAEHDAHASWRWTDGAAVLPPALWQGIDTDFRVDLSLLRSQTYRLGEPEGVAALYEETWLDRG